MCIWKQQEIYLKIFHKCPTFHVETYEGGTMGHLERETQIYQQCKGKKISLSWLFPGHKDELWKEDKEKHKKS
jgi:hypothetical protein